MQKCLIYIDVTYSGGLSNCIHNKRHRGFELFNAPTNKEGVVVIVTTYLPNQEQCLFEVVVTFYEIFLFEKMSKLEIGK